MTSFVNFSQPLPSDSQAESQVIAHVLYDARMLYADGVVALRGEDFFHHKRLWAALHHLQETGVKISLSSLAAHLSGADQPLDEDEMEAVMRYEPEADLKFLASQLKRLSESRLLVLLGGELVSNGYARDTVNAEQVLAQLIERKSALSPQLFETQGEVIDRALLGLSGDLGAGAVPTPYLSLNDDLGGGLPRRVTTGLMARSSMGKTAFALDIATHAAHWLQHTDQTGCVIYLSQDGDPATIVQGYAASLQGHRIGDAQREPALMAGLKQALVRLNRLPVVWNGNKGFTDFDLRQVVASATRQYGQVHLIVADYLQKYDVVARTRDDRERIDKFLRTWSDVIDKSGAAGLLLIQPNRKLEEEKDKRPQLKHARDSSEIENAMQVMLGLYREEYYSPDDESVAGLGEILMLKNKNGERNRTTYAQFRHGLWAPQAGDEAPSYGPAPAPAAPLPKRVQAPPPPNHSEYEEETFF